jgi:hypothetical protein
LGRFGSHKEQGKTLEGGVTIPSKGGWILPLPVAVTVPDLDALPTEQACVEGPCARPEQRQRDPEGSEQQVEPELSGIRERAPDGNNRGESADDRRPETYEQKNADAGSDYVEHGDCGGRSGSQRGNGANDQCAARGDTHEQKPGAGRAMGERGEQSTHAAKFRSDPTPAETLERVMPDALSSG